LAIVVAGRSWLEISLWQTGKDRKKKSIQEEKKKSIQERREVSKQPSSTAEIR
jgi:hypothetical protein